VQDNILGPIDYLAVDFPDGRVTNDGFACLLDLVDRDVIRVLDLEFIVRSPDGGALRVQLESLERDAAVDVAAWQAAESRLLDQADVDAIAAELTPGSVAGVVVYENVWAAPLMAAIDHGGTRIIGQGRVAAEDLMAALG
jgi:hypothetical protein